jgi:hypothetical protein
MSAVMTASAATGPAIVVGVWRSRYLRFVGQQFVLLAAPARSGKGVGIVIPNLLSYPDSAVVLDIKQENYTITAGFRRAQRRRFLIRRLRPHGAAMPRARRIALQTVRSSARCLSRLRRRCEDKP